MKEQMAPSSGAYRMDVENFGPIVRASVDLRGCSKREGESPIRGSPDAVEPLHEQRSLPQQPHRRRVASPRTPCCPPPKPGGRPIKHPRREVVNAIRYVLRTGCAWRMLPNDLPPLADRLPLLQQVALGRDLGARP